MVCVGVGGFVGVVGSGKLDLEAGPGVPGAWSDLRPVCVCAAKTTIARQDLSPGPFKILEQPTRGRVSESSQS